MPRLSMTTAQTGEVNQGLWRSVSAVARSQEAPSGARTRLTKLSRSTARSVAELALGVLQELVWRNFPCECGFRLHLLRNSFHLSFLLSSVASLSVVTDANCARDRLHKTLIVHVTRTQK